MRKARETWVGTWMTAPQLTDPANLPPPPGFVNQTVRQLVRVSLGGQRLRVRLTHTHGTTPVTFTGVHIALGLPGGKIVPGSSRALLFHGEPEVTIPAGNLIVSDPLDFPLTPFSDLAITFHVNTSTTAITGHPGSRCTSYFQTGRSLAAPEFPSPVPVDHWYFLAGVEVVAENATAVVALGDSITDGRGTPTNGNGRWTDYLARRLQAYPKTRHVAVLNAGIGGNCVIQGGLGPSALARLDRDVLAQPGARYLILFEGINDLGTKSADAEALIAAYQQILARVRARNFTVYGATILPCGKSFYDTPVLARDRQAINQWIRTSGSFDAVLDFDAALRDPTTPTRLSAAAESTDFLHPANLGYKVLADSIPLRLFYP
ncbi:MAG: SGNH/GDSL hydrolase family protein [Armatimonas sp.]